MFYYLTMIFPHYYYESVISLLSSIREICYQERGSSISLLKMTITQATRFKDTVRQKQAEELFFFFSAFVLGLIHVLSFSFLIFCSFPSVYDQAGENTNMN